MFDGTDDSPTIIGISEDDEGPQSLQERLRVKRQEIADKHETFIQLPGFEEAGLQVKYRLLDREDVKRISKNITGANGAKRMDRADFQMLVLMDTIINATEGFYTEEPQDDEPQPLMESDAPDADHITSWSMLSKFMDPNGVGEDRQRAALTFCFAGNDFAIGQHGINVQRWMTNTNLDVNETFLGEVV
jgi:hypothetical protein